MSDEYKNYQLAMQKVNDNIDKAIEGAENDPEMGIEIAQAYAKMATKFKVPRSAYWKNTLGLYEVLKDRLALLREELSSDDEPRRGICVDAFNAAILILREDLNIDSQGYGGAPPEDRDFFRKLSKLLAVVEISYNRLREDALPDSRAAAAILDKEDISS
jgi:hypothetical protein